MAVMQLSTIFQLYRDGPRKGNKNISIEFNQLLDSILDLQW
jgi:hypothetical protein